MSTDTVSRIAEVRALWGRADEPPGVLDEVRAAVGLPERRRMPGEEQRVRGFLGEIRWSVEQVAGALRAVGEEVRADPEKAWLLDGQHTWSLRVLGRALSQAATPKRARRGSGRAELGIGAARPSDESAFEQEGDIFERDRGNGTA